MIVPGAAYADRVEHVVRIRPERPGAVIPAPTSKAAVNALTIQYADELRKDRILVNAAAPGFCATAASTTRPLETPVAAESASARETREDAATSGSEEHATTPTAESTAKRTFQFMTRKLPRRRAR